MTKPIKKPLTPKPLLAKKPASTISERDKVYLRLKCLLAVVERGSNITATSPQAKAEEYYSWIMGSNGKAAAKPVPVQKLYEPEVVVSPPGTPKRPEETVTPLADSPFKDNGHPQVAIT